MDSVLSVIQIVAIGLVVLVTVLAERRFRKQRFMEKGLEDSSRTLLPWYWRVQIEAGLMEVSLATAGVAIAMPALVEAREGGPDYLLWLFRSAFLLASSLASLATLWFLRIYVRQFSEPRAKDEAALHAQGEEPFNAFSARKAGPFAALGYALVCLLLGLGLFPLLRAS